MVRYLLAAAIGIVLSTQAYSHHSFSTIYFDDRSVTIEGELVQFLYRNPHSFIYLVVNERGQEVRYAIEWRGAGRLGEQGVTQQSLKVGDRIIISGNPGRNATDHRLRLNSLVRPRDGFQWKQSTYETIQ